MIDIPALVSKFRGCACGSPHECAIGAVRVESGLQHRAGEALREAGFPRKVLVLGDKAGFGAAPGVVPSLEKAGFEPKLVEYGSLRVARTEDVRRVEAALESGEAEGVVAVGTGSSHDPCRLACARRNAPLALFATAASMDGFASYSAPIVDGVFKTTHPAKCPDVILADTAVMARAPAALKSAGFGDMMAKYVALVDWRVSHLVSGESLCENVAGLVREAADRIFALAPRVLAEDEESAAAVFDALLLTGVAMSFTKTSRPGSGTEHILAHFWECMELTEGKTPNFHGTDVGVATLLVMRRYEKFAEAASIGARRETPDWDSIYREYGPLAPDVRRLNTPDTIVDGIDPAALERAWPEIRAIVRSVPSADEIERAMRTAGCACTPDEIGKSPEFVGKAMRLHPYMRRRLSLMRLSKLFA
ncbi:MAG: iron-containing alcohol dehydrogenase [Kiritimatiellae bacterium]|nr:iron-containing alcohol dehydrogenase [Kiritimatiellia bacterium]